MQQSTTPDIVVIGGGIAGGVFSTVMAREGYSVLMLEITEVHRDVVRGEWIAPWGVAEVRRLGLYDLYRSHGGHHLKRHIGYDELIPQAEAEARTLHFSTIMPGDEGPLTIGHPKLCGVLNDAAVTAGTHYLRGVRKVQVTPGDNPKVRFDHGGQSHEISPRLVIAADGRHGKTAQQAGIKLEADPVHHWFSGMLVEDVPDWPSDLQAVGTVGGINYFVFPQAGGKARLYQGVALEDKEKFMGEDAPQRFAESFRFDCVPHSDAIARGKPASHCFVYPNNDSWSDQPFVAGVVAIGDSAGHNDPINGQGLSIAHRDVRIVSDILKSSADWSPSAFQPYADERRERMRRLRMASRLSAVRDCEFGDAARARRLRLHGLFMVDPVVTALMMTPLAGPECAPPEAYNEAALDALLAPG